MWWNWLILIQLENVVKCASRAQLTLVLKKVIPQDDQTTRQISKDFIGGIQSDKQSSILFECLLIKWIYSRDGQWDCPMGHKSLGQLGLGEKSLRQSGILSFGAQGPGTRIFGTCRINHKTVLRCNTYSKYSLITLKVSQSWQNTECDFSQKIFYIFYLRR